MLPYVVQKKSVYFAHLNYTELMKPHLFEKLKTPLG